MKAPVFYRAKAQYFGSFVLALAALFLVPMGKASGAELEDEARSALGVLFAALATGDPAQIGAVLAPEFQLVRSDGRAYDKAEYVARSIPVIRKAPVFNQVKATRNGEIVVVTLRLEVDETIEGKTVQSNAPQLVVFRVSGRTWQVLASANLAKLGDAR